MYVWLKESEGVWVLADLGSCRIAGGVVLDKEGGHWRGMVRQEPFGSGRERLVECGSRLVEVQQGVMDSARLVGVRKQVRERRSGRGYDGLVEGAELRLGKTTGDGHQVVVVLDGNDRVVFEGLEASTYVWVDSVEGERCQVNLVNRKKEG